jgi:hypothetical protein
MRPGGHTGLDPDQCGGRLACQDREEFTQIAEIARTLLSHPGVCTLLSH